MNLCLGNFEREVWLGWQVGKNYVNDFSDPLIISLDTTFNAQKFARTDTHHPHSNYQSKQMYSSLFWKNGLKEEFPWSLEGKLISANECVHKLCSYSRQPRTEVSMKIDLLYSYRVRVITGFLCSTSQCVVSLVNCIYFN